MLSFLVLLLSLLLKQGFAEMEGFIVGGEKATIEQYPHSAFLSIKCVEDYNIVEEWICGSSIIHKELILTAAHCVFDCGKGSIFTVAVGNVKKAEGYKHVIRRYVVHKKYDPEVIVHDIAMMKLVEPLILSDKVQVVMTATTRTKARTAYTAGWGLIDEVNGFMSDVLKYTKQSLLSKKYCIKLLKDIPKGTICAGDISSDDYAAQGDSGSALVIRENKTLIQIGLVSFKEPRISLSVVVYTEIKFHRFAEMEGFIVGGRNASIKDYPHSAFLSVKCDNKDNKVLHWICGASIIHRSILLTAAHCLAECRKNSVITAAVGNEHRYKGFKKIARKFIIHKKYNMELVNYDIGLAMLLEPLVLSDKVQLAVLPKTRPKSQKAFVAGWGLIDEINMKLSNTMRYTQQNIFAKRECVKLLRSIPDGSICAKNPSNKDYASSGDSGSALVIHHNNKHIQIGLVSFKHPRISRSVIVYTDIPYFYKWIQIRIKKLLSHSNRTSI